MIANYENVDAYLKIENIKKKKEKCYPNSHFYPDPRHFH